MTLLHISHFFGLTDAQVIVLHSLALTVATISVLVAIRLERKHAREAARLKRYRIGDHVKFYMQCETDDCILDGKITDIKGPIIEIEPDDTTCGWGNCDKVCLNQSHRINKHYKDVID